MMLLFAIVVDITVILALGLVLALALRGQSAALRHLVLAGALAVAALVPALEVIGPRWSLPILPWQDIADAQSSGLRFASTPSVAAPNAATAVTIAPTSTDWVRLALVAWLAGALVGLAGLITGIMRLRRLTAQCIRVTRDPWRDLADELAQARALPRVSVLQSTAPSLLVTCGMVRPQIVLPVGAESWTDARRRVVLIHELEHIRRGDWATHIVAEAVRAVYWFHPLVWFACRRLRQESEYACDDAVLARGVEPTEYATHLLEIARHVVRRRDVLGSAPAIAHPSTLERRVSAMLNQHRRRQPLTRTPAALTLGTILAIALPLTAATLSDRPTSAPTATGADTPLVATVAPATDVPAVTSARPASAEPTPAVAAAAQQEPASIKGTLYDQLGGVLPGVMVTLGDRSVGATYSTTSNRDGTFVFQELQPATYELQTQLPGFMIVSNVMSIGAGASIERHITMPIGSLEETLYAVCQSSSSPSPRPRRVINEAGRNTGAPQPAGAAPFSGSMGGQIKVPRKTRDANPFCPNGGPAVDTLVRLSARIGIDGYVSDVKPANTPDARPAPEFVESALDAVSLWQFTPTLLNGVPVEAPMSILISYTWK